MRFDFFCPLKEGSLLSFVAISECREIDFDLPYPFSNIPSLSESRIKQKQHLFAFTAKKKKRQKKKEEKKMEHMSTCIDISN